MGASSGSAYAASRRQQTFEIELRIAERFRRGMDVMRQQPPPEHVVSGRTHGIDVDDDTTAHQFRPEAASERPRGALPRPLWTMLSAVILTEFQNP